MSTLYINTETARLLDWTWLRFWFSLGNVVWVQEMPSEHPALFLESPRDTMLS